MLMNLLLVCLTPSVVVETMSSPDALFPPILPVVDNQTPVVRKSGRGRIVVEKKKDPDFVFY